MKTTLLAAILFIQYPLFAQGWTSQTTGTTYGLLSVHFTGTNIGWAVGHEGTVLHTTNGGMTWFFQTSGTSLILRDVHFADISRGWIVGNLGTILRTINAGATWSPQSSGTTGSLEDVYFSDLNNGWVVGEGGTILHTANGGLTWSFQTSGTVLYLTDVHFIDANTGWAVGGGGTIIYTTDGGTTWSNQSSGSTAFLLAIHFIDGQTGWTSGTGGTILHTTNGGATWIDQTSGNINALFGVYFTDALTGWAVGGSGTILHTSNGGGSWFPEISGTPFYLTDVYFANQGAGWTSGLGGLILHYSGGGIPCDEIDSFSARCDPGGGLRALVRLLNSTEYGGETVEFQLDDMVYPVELITNGTHTVGRLRVPNAGPGRHTITLLDPPGCFDPVAVSCQADTTAAHSGYDEAWTGFDERPPATQPVPQGTKLLDNYPNPFNPTTTIAFSLSKAGGVSLRVFNLLGEEVVVLVSGHTEAGYHSVDWSAAGQPSGIYLCRLETTDFVETKKLVLLR